MSEEGDLRQLIKRAQEQGFRHQTTARNHHQFIPPDRTKSMVVTSGTPSDYRSWNNFLADMKRAGFKGEEMELSETADSVCPNCHNDISKGPHGQACPAANITAGTATATTSLGEALAAARAVQPTHPTGQPKLSAAAYVRDFVKSRGPGIIFTNGEALDAIRIHRPEATMQAVHQAMMELNNKGEVARLERGTYRRIDRTAPVAPAAPQANGAAPATDTKEIIAGTRTGNTGIDSNLAELDEALVALAKIENVVKRTRVALVQVAELSSLLAKFNIQS